MFNINEWYTFPGELDKVTCDKIKKLGNKKWKPSTVELTKEGYTAEERRVGKKETYGQSKKSRISEVVWSKDQWLYDIIWPYMEKANFNSGWRYNIKYAESMQITKYEKSGFYTFHRDGKGDHLSSYNRPDNGFLHGNVRKLSMTVLLNNDYEGGEFQFTSYNREKCTITTVEQNKIGSIIVFPSYMEHRITPVIKGTRYSLVVWFLGPPFV